MKNLLLVLTVILFTSTAITAQRMNREKINLLKTSFITDALDFTSDEAEKFWPIYNLYTNKIQDLKISVERGQHRKMKASEGIDNISEEMATKLLNQSMEVEKEISKSKIEMIEALKKILSAKKIIRLQKAERDFNRTILQEYGRRKRMQGQ